MADVQILGGDSLQGPESLFDLAPCGLVVCDARGLVLRVNAFFRRMSGLPDDMFAQSRPFHQYMTRPSRFVFNAQTLPQLNHVGVAQEVALDIQGADGSGIAVLLNGHFDKVSGLLHLAIFPARDRREREHALLRAQNELTQNRDYLELAEKLAHVGHWRVDLDTKISEWSSEIYSIYGLDPDTYVPVMGGTIDFYHPDDRQSVRDTIAEAIRDKAPFTFRKRLIRPDGEERVVLASGICQLNAHGVVTHLFGVFQDVTEAAQAQAKIEHNEARYRLLADHANDIITTFDLNGTFEYVSPAVVKVLGYDPDELVGRNVRDIVHPEDYERTQAAYFAYVVGGDWGNAPRIQYRAVHRDGSFIWAEAHPTAIFNAGGDKVVGFQDVVRDISGQKATEEALARASVEANAAAEAKSQFLATMSHELRTPLTSIIGFSGLLRDLLAENDELRRHSQRIHTAGQGLLGLINDILDHSRLEAGQLELDLALASVPEIINDVVGLLEFQAAAKGLTLNVMSADDLPAELLVDDARLRQILLNLVGNAIKFTDHGTVAVTVAMFSIDGETHLSFRVRDTGPGISEDGLKHLFQRFSQVDGKAHDSSGGTGLGLSICKQLTELMGGEIGVSSRLGEGAEFWFDILVPEVAEVSSLASWVGQGPHRAGRILVVDDQEAVADLLVNMLIPLGHTVDTASNGYEAVEACRNAVYDLIIMDINMPVMDGFAAATAIREDCPFNAHTPMIAVTAAGGERRLHACLAAGMNDMLAKPINPSALVHALSVWMADTDSLEDSTPKDTAA